MRELQLLMLEMRPSNLADIYVFFKTFHCPNLEKLFVEVNTSQAAMPALFLYTSHAFLNLCFKAIMSFCFIYFLVLVSLIYVCSSQMIPRKVHMIGLGKSHQRIV